MIIKMKHFQWLLLYMTPAQKHIACEKLKLFTVTFKSLTVMNNDDKPHQNFGTSGEETTPLFEVAL